MDTYEIENTEQTNSAVYACNGIPLKYFIFMQKQAQLSWKEKNLSTNPCGECLWRIFTWAKACLFWISLMIALN